MASEKHPDILRVELGKRSYDITIGNNFLADAAAYITPHLARPWVMVVTDESVAQHHLVTLQESLEKSGVEVNVIILPSGEQTKSFANLQKLLENMLDFSPERSDTVIALGGGVIGDITGFAASIVMRGINFIQIPTTLLAMVDSSVGGKTGVNTRQGKNLVGSFYQPKLVLADVSLLETLPKRELLSGFAEVVKYGLIGDADFFDVLERDGAEKLYALDIDFLRFIVKKSCQAKADIVAEDEREKGVRALLNLGHTFGHALEAETGYGSKLLHGEAVAIGMIMAFNLSVSHGLCDAVDAARVRGYFASVGLPVAVEDVQHIFGVDNLIKHMEHDKKVEQGKLVFVLVRAIGEAFVDKNVNKNDVRKFLSTVIVP